MPQFDEVFIWQLTNSIAFHIINLMMLSCFNQDKYLMFKLRVSNS